MFFVWGDMIPRSYSARGVRGYQAQLTREDSFHLSTSPSPSPARREGGRVPTPKQPFYHHILLCGSLFLVNHAFQPQKLKEVLYNKCSDSPILNILAPPQPPLSLILKGWPCTLHLHFSSAQPLTPLCEAFHPPQYRSITKV